MKKILFVMCILIFLLSFQSVLADITIGDYTIQLIGLYEVEIVDYSGTEKHLIVPTLLDGKYTVKSISGYAFYGNDYIISLRIPGSVKSIHSYAFAGCSNLVDVVLEAGVKSIGYHAFADCPNLISFTMNEGLESVDYSFDNSPIQELIFPDSVTSLDLGSSNDSDSSALKENLQKVRWPAGCPEIQTSFYGFSALSEIELPDNLTHIGSYAFSNCENLKKITLPDSLQSIGNGAFYNCDSLITVDVPDSVEEISNSLFEECDKLTKVNLGTGIKKIGEDAFMSCDSLSEIIMNDGLETIETGAFSGSPIKNLIIPDTVTNLSPKAISDCWDYELEEYNYTLRNNLQKIHWPAGVSEIPEKQFQDFIALEEVELSEPLKAIGSSAFEGCSSLMDISLPDSLESIGSWAFKNCDNLTTVVIPDLVETINYSLLAYCDGLTSVTLGSSVKTIDNYAFAGCSSLTSVFMNDGLEAIGDYVFSGSPVHELIFPDSVTSLSEKAMDALWDYELEEHNYALRENLQKVHWPAGVPVIPGSQFYGFRVLEEVELPEGVTDIGDRAFDYSGLLKVTLPGTLKSIGNGAFSSCYNMTTVTIPSGALETIPENLFNSCSKLKTITIPEGVKTIGKYAFGGCNSLTTITIPNSVETIGEWAFRYCNGLTSVSLGSGVKTISDSAFSECRNLTVINMNEGLKTIEKNAFIGSPIEELIFPDSVTTLSPEAINDTNHYKNSELKSSLKKVHWPAGVTTVPENQFLEFYALNEVELPEGVTEIGDNAFSYCDNLENIKLPASLTTIGDFDIQSENIKVWVFAGTYAETWAIEHGYSVKYLGPSQLTTSITIKNTSGTVVNNTTRTLKSSNEYQLTATAAPSGASQNFNWSTSNSSVATITSAGKLTFKQANKQVTVTCAATDGSGVNASFKITYSPAVTLTLTISQGNVLGYSGGIEMKTAYDANATGYSIAVYDVANEKTVTPTIDTPVKSGSAVTIKIHGSSLVNGNIYKLTVYKYNTSGGTTTKSNTVTVYGMPHSAISKVTAQPIGTGVRLDSEFKAGTDGTRYYVYNASTGAQVKKVNLTGPASQSKISGLENNKLYYAYARPYKIYNNQYLLGPKSKPVYFVPVAMPSGVTVAFSDAATAVISTNQNSTARGVRVLYREEGGSLKNGCVQAGNQCSIPNLSQAKSYEFYVMHYNIINNVRHYGSGITIQYNAPTVSTLPRPTGIKVNAGNPTWTFTITKDAAAKGISVLYRINEGNFALACEKDGASCTMDLTKDKAYTFFIMQYKVVNGKKVYSPGATVKNLYGTKSADEEIPEDAFIEVDETFDTEQLYTIMEDYLTEEDLNALEAMELAALDGEAGYAEADDIETYEEEDLYDLVPGALMVMAETDIPEPTEDDFTYVSSDDYSMDEMADVYGKAVTLSTLTISQGNVLGYSSGIEVKTAYDKNATGYSIAVYDVANKKTVKPTIDKPVKSGSTVTIKIHGNSLVNGNIYRLKVYKYNTSSGTTVKSNTVTVYGMPHSVINSVTAQPIGTGVRLDSVFKTGTDGTRYYVYDASTGKQVKKQNLTGPASQIKITGLENNKLYYAYARPYKIYNNQYLLGPQSKLVYFAPVAMPAGVSVQYSDLTTAVISTNANSTARGVRVLYREVGGSLKNGCVQAGNQCTIANLSQAKSYEFYVMHYNIIDNVRHYGSGVTIQTNAPTLSTLARPTGIKIYAGNPTWTFTITKDAAAQGISVLYRINEGNFALACEKDGASCTKDLSKDKAYTFFIMQYKLVDGKKVYSAGATVKNLYGTKTIDGNDLVTEFVEAEESITSDELYDVLEDYMTQSDLNGLEAMDVLATEEPETFEADSELDAIEEEDLNDDVVPEEFRTMEVIDSSEPTEADFIDVPMEGALTETAPKGPDGELWNGAEELTSYDESDGTPGLYFYGIDDSRYPYEPPAPSFQNK